MEFRLSKQHELLTSAEDGSVIWFSRIESTGKFQFSTSRPKKGDRQRKCGLSMNSENHGIHLPHGERIRLRDEVVARMAELGDEECVNAERLKADWENHEFVVDEGVDLGNMQGIQRKGNGIPARGARQGNVRVHISKVKERAGGIR